MGHKTHPIGFRLAISKDWQAHWFAPKGRLYKDLLLEDLEIRKTVHASYADYPDSGISRIEINKGAKDVTINVHSARPGILIGRDGARVKELRQKLETATKKRVQLNIIEVTHPELDAQLVSRSIAEQLERRVSYRRATRQAASRAMQSGAKGIKIILAGRIMGAEIARKEKVMEGRVPLHTLRADIDFAISEAATMMGRIGVKVWIYKGDILPTPPEGDGREEEQMPSIEVKVQGEEGRGDTTAQASEVPQGAPGPTQG